MRGVTWNWFPVLKKNCHLIQSLRFYFYQVPDVHLDRETQAKRWTDLRSKHSKCITASNPRAGMLGTGQQYLSPSQTQACMLIAHSLLKLKQPIRLNAVDIWRLPVFLQFSQKLLCFSKTNIEHSWAWHAKVPLRLKQGHTSRNAIMPFKRKQVPASSLTLKSKHAMSIDVWNWTFANGGCR